jgi:hypothetical protein
MQLLREFPTLTNTMNLYTFSYMGWVEALDQFDIAEVNISAENAIKAIQQLSIMIKRGAIKPLNEPTLIAINNISTVTSQN